jgi:hypothetical protein
VVLPFINLGGGPDQDYFVDGITESLTTDLSRIAGSFVIARNTAFTFKGKAIDVQLGPKMVAGFNIYEADSEAIIWLRRSIETNRSFPLAHFHLAAALALTGQLDQARAAALAGLALERTFTIRRFRLNASSDNPIFFLSANAFMGAWAWPDCSKNNI